MPYIIRPNRIHRFVAAALGSIILLGASAAAAGANTACPATAASTWLASYGDNSAYALLTGASFESGAPGWSLSNAEVVGAPAVNGGSHVLVIRANGSATTPAFCVSDEYPTFRFFAHQVGSASAISSLNVTLHWSGLLGLPMSTSVALVQAGTSWTLSPTLKLAKALPIVQGTSLKVSIQFQPTLGGTWAIDYVYIDPYSR